MTREEVIETFMAIKPKPKPPEKPPEEKAKERWNEEAKPSEVIYSTAAAHNDAATRRMLRERELIAQANTPQARAQAELDCWWQSMRNAQREERRIHYVGGFLEGRDDDHNPIDRL